MTGGTVTDVDGFRYHTFTSSDSLVVSTGGSVEVLLVGGGGAGSKSWNAGGGGGAGGVRVLDGANALVLTPATYIITVGDGGSGSTSIGNGASGGSSSLVGASINESAAGGGGGAHEAAGISGGSGGGGGGGSNAFSGGAGTAGQGFAGGNGYAASGSDPAGGGGGGASAVGGNSAYRTGGNGGNGITVWGSSYGGGGGGSWRGGGTAGNSVGGIGGGGGGVGYNGTGVNGTANTGGGGGGNGGGGTSGGGGSGIVIVRYQIGGAVLWTPDSLADLRAWYDASDTSTVTESSNLITAWNDKSGGGYHLSASGGARPTYTSGGLDGKHVVTFNGTSNEIKASTASHWAFLNQSGGAEIVAVWKAGTTSDPEAIMPLLTTSRGSVVNEGYLVAHDSRASFPRDDVVVSAVRNATSGGSGTNFYLAVSSDNFHAANTPTIIGASLDLGNATATDKIRHRVNGGTSQGNNASTRNTSTANPIDPLRLGYFNGSIGWLDGYIAELVICNAKLSDADRERVEGYLAHKWGLAGDLPIGHPYRNATP